MNMYEIKSAHAILMKKQALLHRQYNLLEEREAAIDANTTLSDEDRLERCTVLAGEYERVAKLMRQITKEGIILSLRLCVVSDNADSVNKKAEIEKEIDDLLKTCSFEFLLETLCEERANIECNLKSMKQLLSTERMRDEHTEAVIDDSVWLSEILIAIIHVLMKKLEKEKKTIEEDDD